MLGTYSGEGDPPAKNEATPATCRGAGAPARCNRNSKRPTTTPPGRVVGRLQEVPPVILWNRRTRGRSHAHDLQGSSPRAMPMTYRGDAEASGGGLGVEGGGQMGWEAGAWCS